MKKKEAFQWIKNILSEISHIDEETGKNILEGCGRACAKTHGLPDEAPAFDEDGNPRQVICPHCGFRTEGIILVRTSELPSKIDRFFQEEGYAKIPKTWRKLLNDFINWLKKREDGL